MISRDLVIIGGGPAGLAAAVAAYDAGLRDILLIERDYCLGGVLNQCIHAGFGLHTFKAELTGPEYAQRYIDMLLDRRIEYKTDCMVLSISPEKVVRITNKDDGIFEVQAKAIILAMGCRERTRGSLNIPGTRPAGVFTAGTAQRLVNIEGYLPGKKVVCLGSGDIGLIMARRMTLEGAEVLCVAEVQEKSPGLKRNIIQCLDDFGIPLLLRHNVINVYGEDHITGVDVAEINENFQPIPGTTVHYECDCLLLSTGLIPENELTVGLGAEMDPMTKGPVVDENFMTTVPGIFAAGNVQAVHGLADDVSVHAEIAGRAAAEYIGGGRE